MTPKLHSLLVTPDTRRQQIREKTTEGLAGLFPIIGRSHTISVKDISFKNKEYSSNEQKDAIMRGRTVHETVTGTLTLTDNKTGKVVSVEKNHNLAQVPYLTERQTFIVGGNEYTLPNQLRLKSGVYTRERANGEFEASFNLSKGANFRLSMEPETGRMHMELGTSKLPLYPLLRAMSVPDTDIRKYWGADLHAVNVTASTDKEDALVTKAVSKLKRAADVMPSTLEGKKTFLHDYFGKTELDPEVTNRTLNTPFTNASPLALLTASRKLIRVQKGEEEADDRDNLEFKTIHSVDDFFKERLDIHARRTIAKKVE